MKFARIFWTAFALLAVGLALASLLLGDEYYALPRMARHHAAEHKTLGPGGTYGHLLGIGGSMLMVSNLLYLVRRRWSRVEGLGDLSSWLAFHVAFGVAGVAKEMGPGKTVVVVLPDGGRAYISKFFSDEWMRDNGFLEAGPAVVRELLGARKGRGDVTGWSASHLDMGRRRGCPLPRCRAP